VSRQALIDSPFSTVICAPVYTSYAGLSTQIPVGPEAGLKHDSSIHCDELTSLRKPSLRHFVGTLTDLQLDSLDRALRVALDMYRPSAL
jgi:mRNA interferase MazF